MRAMKFYHGTNLDLAVGEKLLAYSHEEVIVDSEGHLAEELALMAFDLFKPEGAIGRQEAIYLTDKAEDCMALGAQGERVYEVEVVGEVQCYNSGWFDAVFDAVFGYAVEEWERGNGAYAAWINIYPHLWPTPEVAKMCRAYWAGEAAPANAYPFKWEYLAREARVVGPIEVVRSEPTLV
jgi:hypothetical protein